ncbi:UNVERIFIED_CONTAM: hypothetical protein Slati_3767800 [Sesamum latifolium]|uniref:Uncharacterized protein n=1 Tax=Sesamum latifolium TaxID=2727402 RepID=A0AAW2U7U1_9LAMI
MDVKNYDRALAREEFNLLRNKIDPSSISHFTPNTSTYFEGFLYYFRELDLPLPIESFYVFCSHGKKFYFKTSIISRLNTSASTVTATRRVFPPPASRKESERRRSPLPPSHPCGLQHGIGESDKDGCVSPLGSSKRPRECSAFETSRHGTWKGLFSFGIDCHE